MSFSETEYVIEAAADIVTRIRVELTAHGMDYDSSTRVQTPTITEFRVTIRNNDELERVRSLRNSLHLKIYPSLPSTI